MSLSVIFSHGKESGPSGIKITAMRAICDDLHITSHSVDYRGIDDPEVRADRLGSEIEQCQGSILLVGSSMGSYVSLRACRNTRVRGLLLLAPAVYMPGYDTTDVSPGHCRTLIIHGWQDEIVPVNNAIKFAKRYKSELLLLDDDHVLRHSLDRICDEFRRFLTHFISTATPD